MSGEGRTVVTLVTWDIKVEGAVEDLREEDQRLLWGERGSGYPLEKSPSHLLSPGLALRGPFSSSIQLLRMFFRQQDEIRRLKEELAQKDIRIRQLQLELKNLRNSPKNC